MTQRTVRSLTLAALIGPLTLALAACGDNSSTGGETLSGEPVAKVAPPQGQTWSAVISKTAEGGYVMGNPDAPIKLIEYASLTCPHCAQFTETSDEDLRANFIESGQVSIELRNFVMNPLDLSMAMLVRCGAPESFFALTKQTFANQSSIIDKWTQVGEAPVNQATSLPPEQRYNALASLAGLQDFYSARGISADQAKQCLADAATAETLVKNTAEQSEKYNITGTPSFLLNGQLIPGNTWPEIKAALEKAGAR